MGEVKETSSGFSRQQQAAECAGPQEPFSTADGKHFRLTVEIPILLIAFSSVVSGVAITNLLMYRTCLNVLGYDETVCELLQAPGDRSNETQFIEIEAQFITTIATMLKSTLEALVPACLALFLGVWSNKYGRKPLIVWPLFGFAISQIMIFLYSLFGSLGPWWIVVTALPYSFGGGLSILLTGTLCLINDLTSTESRTARLALMQAANFVGTIIGGLASSYIVAAIGTQYLLLLSASIAFMGYLFAALWIEESVTGAVKGGIKTVFDLSFAKDMSSACVKKRPNFERASLFLLLTANGFTIFCMHGIPNIEYLYTRTKLMWSITEFSVYTATSTIIMVLGLLFGVIFLQKVYKISDLIMTMASYLSASVGMLAIALATEAWHMYLSSLFSFLKGLSAPLIRSALSKMIPKEDVAKVFALLSTIEAIIPVFSPLVYSTIYSYTIITIPGAAYIMSASIYAGCFAMAGLVQYFVMKYPGEQYAEAIPETMPK